MSSAQENYIETSINTSGIYFDPVGSFKIVDGYLNVIIPVDISYIQSHIKNLNGVIGSSKFLCKQSFLYSDTECINLLQPLSIRYKDIIRDFESISHLIEARSKRSAWIGGVGTIFKHLFGTMDEEDAVQYSEAIKLIENDQTKLSKLVKQNILVTTSTISSMKDTLNKISVNEQQLNHAIDTLILTQQNITALSDKMLLKSKINDILNMLESSLLTLSFKIEDIINGIMFSKSNILYPSIITPKQLFTELVENYRFLADYHQFPVSLSLENIYTLMNVSEIATYYNDEKIVFVLKVPLVSSKNCNLYHNIPYPVGVSNSTYVTIIPSTKYIAITRDRSYYCKLDSLISCRIIYNTNYICENVNVYSNSTTPICESEIMSKALITVPNICKTNFISGHLDIWQPLSNNKWIYVITNPSKLSVDCHESTTTEIIIKGTGILKLPMYCIGYYKDSRLIPKYSKIIKLQPIQINLNLINDSCCNSEILLKTKSRIPTLNLSNINLDSITSQKYTETSNIINDLDTIIKKPHIVQYGEYYSYTTIVISVIIITVILILIFKFVKSSKCHSFLFKRKIISEIEKAQTLNENDIDSSSIPMPKLRTSLS